MEKDITKLVAERAVQMLRPLLRALEEQVFAGPSSVRLSKAEVLEKFQKMTPEELSTLTDQIGVDELIAQTQELK